MVKIEELRVYNIAPNRRVVGWVFQPTADDLSGLSVEIYRSFSPEDDFEKIADVVFPQTYYRDTLGSRDKWRKLYYKIIVAFQGRTIESEVAWNNGYESVLAREMIRRSHIDLRFSGMPVMVYLKRKGMRCPVCWDPIAKKITRSNCTSCFATGYEGGYYTPILTSVNIIPSDKNDQPDVTQRQATRTSLRMGIFPVVRPRDLLYEVNFDRRWRIVRITPIRHDGVLVHQELTELASLNPTDVEHQLPIPTGLDYVVKPHWSSNVKKKHDKIAHPEGDPAIERVELWR